MNESEKSERDFEIIMNAKGKFQNKVKRKKLLENTIDEGEERRRRYIYIYRICHLYDILDERKEKNNNNESHYNTVEALTIF